jgi:hypothetical protein
MTYQQRVRPPGPGIRKSGRVQCRNGVAGSSEATMREGASDSAYGSNPSALVVNSTSGSIVRHAAAKSRMNLGPHKAGSLHNPESPQ